MKGFKGLEALFAKEIKKWDGNIIKRPTNIPDNYTTCPQAEVLYPGEIST